MFRHKAEKTLEQKYVDRQSRYINSLNKQLKDPGNQSHLTWLKEEIEKAYEIYDELLIRWNRRNGRSTHNT